MTASESGEVGAKSQPGGLLPGEEPHDTGANFNQPRRENLWQAARQPGSRPIVWKWWLLAALLSLALWAGIIALVL